MFLENLELVDFRNYEHAELELTPGATVFVGPNGQGKTNLVEAAEYLARLGSHRVNSDAPLIRAGTTQAVVRGRVRAGLADERHLLIEIEINSGRANRARLNRVAQRSPRNLLGALRVVVFSPEELNIVKGDPAARREFIDDLIVARWPRLAGVKADYDRALRQRNALLKTLAGRFGSPSAEDLVALDAWSEQLANFGSELMAARADTLADLSPYVATAYAAIAPVNNLAQVAYRPRVPLEPDGTGSDSAASLLGTEGEAATQQADKTPDQSDGTKTRANQMYLALLEAMRARRPDELRRGVSLVGPHRDEVELTIGELPAKGYASHGESWSLALALRIGSFELLQAEEINPVLILDDVFAELDQTRRARLLDAIVGTEDHPGADQILITSAVREDVPESLNATWFQVSHGTVTAA
jgi:DNA replication and repair protein RecF